MGCATRSERRISPLPALLHAFLDAGLAPDRFAEGGAPIPTVLAMRARVRA